jgi:hypothetical protein
VTESPTHIFTKKSPAEEFSSLPRSAWSARILSERCRFDAIIAWRVSGSTYDHVLVLLHTYAPNGQTRRRVSGQERRTGSFISPHPSHLAFPHTIAVVHHSFYYTPILPTVHSIT